ncbi:MAG: hypothetical protein BAJATHORv1_50102 [Candidatus Thorarchaeota archaeon]|nr:MAG: hypothetical protein BAJATHORv1_50102 [Candidatus Thorarchaeota archaeon]
MMMFRLVIISPLPPQKTGESTYTVKLINKLVEIANIEIFAITGKEANPLPEMGGRVHTVPIWNGRDVTYPLTLLRKIREINPHLVHVQFGPDKLIYGGMFGEVMLILLVLLQLCGIRTTVTSHSTWMKDQVQRRVRTYPRLGVFAPFAEVFFSIYMKLLDLGTNTIQLSTVCLNSELKRVFLKEYGIPESKILEIPHPCSKVEKVIEPDEAKSQLGLNDRRIVLVFGFIKPGKGLEQAIEAINLLSNRYPDILLLIAGKPVGAEGERYLEDTKTIVKKYSLEENIRIDSGYIQDKDIPKYFSAASIILVPYTESVGASGPIHNFAGYGTPILASDVGYHNQESLDSSVVTFRSRDAKDLAEKIDYIIGNPETAKKMGDTHKQCAKSQSWIQGAKQTLINYRITLRK